MAFHVAENVVYLRRLRGLSQAKLADKMKTSQPKIAKLEAGDHNVTLRTLVRLAKALRGRVRLTIHPEEAIIPVFPNWWEMESTDATSVSCRTFWNFRGYLSKDDEQSSQSHVAGVWSRDHERNEDLLSSGTTFVLHAKIDGRHSDAAAYELADQSFLTPLIGPSHSVQNP